MPMKIWNIIGQLHDNSYAELVCIINIFLTS